MTDLMKIAQHRRAELQAELARMDEFIRIGNALLRSAQPGADRSGAEPGPQEPARDAQPAGQREPAPGVATIPLRRSPALVLG